MVLKLLYIKDCRRLKSMHADSYNRFDKAGAEGVFQAVEAFLQSLARKID